MLGIAVGLAEAVGVDETEDDAVGVDETEDDAVGVAPPANVTVAVPPDVAEDHPGPTSMYEKFEPVVAPTTVTVKVAVPEALSVM